MKLLKLIIKRVPLYIALIYGGLCLYIYAVQETLIFFPVKAHAPYQEIKGAKDVTYSVDGLKLRGWLVNENYAGERLIIYYGGNAEDVYYNIHHFSSRLKAAVLLVNYRGYGLSEGGPGQDALFSDALHIIDETIQTYSPQKTILFGRSLGTGVATYVASKIKNDGVILVTPFDSMLNLARKHYPLYPASLLLKHKFDSTLYAPEIRSPILVLYGPHDRIVPAERTENLFNFFKSDYYKIRIEGADHNDIASYPEYWKAISEFINKS